MELKLSVVGLVMATICQHSVLGKHIGTLKLPHKKASSFIFQTLYWYWCLNSFPCEVYWSKRTAQLGNVMANLCKNILINLQMQERKGRNAGTFVQHKNTFLVKTFVLYVWQNIFSGSFESSSSSKFPFYTPGGAACSREHITQSLRGLAPCQPRDKVVLKCVKCVTKSIVMLK